MAACDVAAPPVGEPLQVHTAALQAALDKCASGGRVVLAQGATYVSGGLVMAGRGVHLHLPHGTTIVGSAEVGGGQQGWVPAQRHEVRLPAAHRRRRITMADGVQPLHVCTCPCALPRAVALVVPTKLPHPVSLAVAVAVAMAVAVAVG